MSKVNLFALGLFLFTIGVQAKNHEIEKGIAPEQAIKFLQNGNARFQSGKLRKDGQGKADIARLSKGQKPHSIVLSCSDSRVPPEVVFDQKLGEIFVVRTAGESIDASAIASIEYAVEHLGSRLILVMGHSHCGAVKAALSTFGGKDAGSPHLNKLVADIQPRIQEFSRAPASDDVKQPSWANAKGVARDLLLRSEIIRKKVDSGDVAVKSALYDLRSGGVEVE
jgi:carbonic anhydrase